MFGRIIDFVRWLLGRIPKSKLESSTDILFYALIRSEQGKKAIAIARVKYPEDEMKMAEDLLIFLKVGILEIAEEKSIWRDFVMTYLRRKILLYLNGVNTYGLRKRTREVWSSL